MSKKSAMFIALIVLLSVTGLYIALPSGSDQPTSQNNDTPTDDTDPAGNGENTSTGQVNISGISQDGNGGYEVDPENISQRHRSELLNRSAVVEHDLDRSEKRIEKFGSTMLVSEETSVGQKIQYSDGVITYTTEIVANETGYSATRGSLSDSLYHKSGIVRALFSDLGVDSVRDREGGYSVEMSAQSGIENLSLQIADVNNINEAEATVNITDSGIVRDLDLELIGESFLGIPQTDRYQYEITQLGGVNIDEPVWVADAETSVSLISLQIDETNNWIILDHEGLSPVSSGDRLQILTANGDSTTVNFTRSVSSGDRMYVRPTTGNDWEITYNREPINSGVVELSDDTEIIIRIVEENQDGTNTLYSANTLTENSS